MSLFVMQKSVATPLEWLNLSGANEPELSFSSAQ